MKNLFLVVPVFIAMGFFSSSYGGFVSSNGMSQLAGLVCSEQPSQDQKIEWQLKYIPAKTGYVARKVIVSHGRPVEVEILSPTLDCEVSRYPNEPAIENRCFGRHDSQDAGSSVFQSVPFRGQLHFLLETPLVEGGSLWKSFPAENCKVLANEKIKP